MTTYIVLYILIFLFAWLLKQYYSDDKYRKRITTICFVLVVSVVALRHPSMGVDLGYGEHFLGYLNSFGAINNFSWDEILELEGFLNYEKGYIIFNKLIGSIFLDQQFFLAACAVVSLLPIFFVIYKKSVDSTMSIFILLGIPAFLMLFSGLRQAIAIGICMLSVLFIQNKKPIFFALVVLFASTFHSSALMFLFAYPAYYIKLSLPNRILSTALLGIVFIFREALFPVLCAWFGYEDVTMDNNGAITLFLVFVAIYIYCFLFDDGAEHQGLLNLFYIACFCQSMSGLHSTVMRVGYYYMIPLVILLPAVIHNTRDNYIRDISKLIVPGCFIAFALYSFYTSTWAETYPHYWFWQSIS